MPKRRTILSNRNQRLSHFLQKRKVIALWKSISKINFKRPTSHSSFKLHNKRSKNNTKWELSKLNMRELRQLYVKLLFNKPVLTLIEASLVDRLQVCIIPCYLELSLTVWIKPKLHHNRWQVINQVLLKRAARRILIL